MEQDFILEIRMTSLREKAKVLARDLAAYACDNADPDSDPELVERFFNKIHEALEAAYKQGAMSRVSGPSDEAAYEFIEVTLDGHDADNEEIASSGQALIGWCLNSLKITPLKLEDVWPDAETRQKMWMEAESDGLYTDALGNFVAAKLEGK